MDQLFTALVIGICYLGPGAFFSRFFDTRFRNNPVFWILLSLIISPLYVSIRSVFGDVSHLELLYVSAILFWCALLPIPIRKIFTLLPEKKKASFSAALIQIGIALLFFLALATAKLSLLNNIHDVIWDDISKTQVVISTGYDLSNPRSYRDIATPLIYHHFDYILPGAIFRLTSLSAQEAWYTHNILEYIAMLAFLIYIGTYFFRTTLGSVSFFLMATIAGGGLEYFLYRVIGKSPPFGLYSELWDNNIGKLNGGGLQFELWSQFYSFQWAPHHMLAFIIFLLLVILVIRWEERCNKYLASALAGGLIGFSIFVFLTGVVSLAFSLTHQFLRTIFLRGEALLRMRWRILFSALTCLTLFACFFLPQYTLYQQKNPTNAVAGNIINDRTLTLNFCNIDNFYKSDAGRLFTGVFGKPFTSRQCNVLFTAPFILFVDLGLIFLLAAAFFLFLPAPASENGLRTRRIILYGIAVTYGIIFFQKSIHFDDLFMRGSLVLQGCATLAAALFLDESRRRTSRAWLIIPLLLLFNSITFFHGISSEIRFSESSIRNYWQYIYDTTPKNAVIYSENACHEDSPYFLNRHCMKRSLTQIETMIQTKELAPGPAYYLGQENVERPFLNLVFGNDKGPYIYKILH